MGQRFSGAFWPQTADNFAANLPAAAAPFASDLQAGAMNAWGSFGGFDLMEALRSAMIIGALPFTMLMGLMCISLGKAMWRDHLRVNQS